MSLLKTLTVRPWLPEPPPPPLVPGKPVATVGLRVLMVVIGSLFGLFTLAFFMRAQLADWESLTAVPGPLPSLAPLWLNTALLAASSLAFQAASRGARRGQLPLARKGLAFAGVFACAFLIGQGALWQDFVNRGYFVASNPAASFFYLLTAVHGLHLAGGLIAWGRNLVRAWRAQAPDPSLRLGVSLCAQYWHFLFAVWLLVFALLASPRETLVAIAEICGLR